MSSQQEFDETYETFCKIYEKCSSLISNGIELETTDENMVRSKVAGRKASE